MPNPEILVSLFSFNEGDKLKRLVAKFPEDRNYDILFIDDGSTDGSYVFLKEHDFFLIRHEQNRGIGCGIREAINFGREHDYKIIVIMAANGKMLPEHIGRMVAPIVEKDFDYVQGSRNLSGGESPNLPMFRKVMINIFTKIVNIFTGYKGTDITCGFRAYKLSPFDDKRFHLEQAWLNRYEMEYYIHYHFLKGGYKLTEVPITMAYPEVKKNYSKIKPFVGWWSMIRPWLFLIFRLKK